MVRYKTWHFIGTLLWSALGGVFVLLAQMLYMGLIANYFPHQQPTSVFLQSGTVMSTSEMVLALAGIPFIVLAAYLKKGTDLKNYFALQKVPFKQLGLWLLGGILLTTIFDGLSNVFNYTQGYQFMYNLYFTTHPVWLVWLAVVITAPLFEELAFRGFMLTGFANSFLKPTGAVILTSAIWAVIHTQYGIFELVWIFLLGLLMATARIKTGSIYAPLAIHITTNFLATAEVALGIFPK